jgi:predicted O-methyltransferase YrrM
MIPRRARPRALHLIDPWRFVPTLPRRWYGGALAHSQAEMDAIHAGVMARFANEPAVMIHRAPSVDAAPRFPVASIDFIYVDGDHSEDAVFADLNAWFPKCRPGGHIVCDDMFWRDEAGKASVAAAIERFVAQLPHGAATHELWENQFVFTRAQIEL